MVFDQFCLYGVGGNTPRCGDPQIGIAESWRREFESRWRQSLSRFFFFAFFTFVLSTTRLMYAFHLLLTHSL